MSAKAHNTTQAAKPFAEPSEPPRVTIAVGHGGCYLTDADDPSALPGIPETPEFAAFCAALDARPDALVRFFASFRPVAARPRPLAAKEAA